jgi:hypothetical protein
MAERLIIKFKGKTKGKPTIVICGYSYYHKKDNVDSIRFVCHQKIGIKECYASLTISKDGTPEIRKLNGFKMKDTNKQQQLKESHDEEIPHEKLYDVDLDVLDTVHR